MTYSPTNLCSTIGAVGLNFSVRDGKRWNPNAINRLNKGPIFHIVTQIKVNLLLKQTIHILINYETSIAWMYRSMLMAQARTFSLARKKSFRAISTARLNMLPCLHLQPINVVVYNDPQGKSNLVVGFALRCFQRLSRPDADTRRCPWRDNRYTGGQSITVLSY